MKPKILLPFLIFFFILPILLPAQWTSLGSGITTPSRSIAGIFPIDEDVIWGFTWHRTDFIPTHDYTRTIDGGQTWLPGTLNGVASEQFPIYLFPLDGQTAWLATADEQNPIAGHVYKTTDGGNTWIQQTTGFTGFNETPAGIYFWNENEGFAYGATCYEDYNDQIAIYTTDDGGENWTKVVASGMPVQQPGEAICIWNFASFFSVVGDTVWFGTSMARIFKSVDRGHSWEAFSTPISNSSFISSVRFKDGQTGLALSYQPFGIARTTDGGENWDILPGTYPSVYRGAQVEYIPGTRGTWLIVASHDKYLVSYDDGEHWETFDSNIEPWSVEFLDANTGFAGRYDPNGLTPSIFKWTGAPLGNRLFVNEDATGVNNGLSWEDAFNDLQDAIAIAENGDQIWVAEGTYLPGYNPEATIRINTNLHLYGGFMGTETSLEERGAPTDHPTILSGDLNGDDIADDFTTNRSDNAMSVVTANDSVQVVIDGFTISHGHAPTGEPDETGRGGGLHARLDNGGSLVVRNCSFKQNFAGLQGGGMFAQNWEAGGEEPFVIENTTFQANRSGGNGGGVYISQWGDNSAITVRNCQFNENKTQWNGGGLGYFSSNSASIHSSFEIDSCAFSQNSAEEVNGSALSIALWGQETGFSLKNTSFIENGPALFGTVSILGNTPIANGNVEVSNCLFERNIATYSTGIDIGSLPGTGYFTYTIYDCDFIDNQAEVSGGLSLYGESPSLLIAENCYFSGNNAVIEGGALLVATNHPEFEARISNCIINNNSSPFAAGVSAYNFTEEPGMTQDAKITFENCLLTGNSGDGAFGMTDIGNVKLLNCTIADNPAGGIRLAGNSSITLQNNIVYNPNSVEFQALTNDAVVTSLGGNLIGDDSFSSHALAQDLQPVNDPQAMFMGVDDYRLHEGSPAINRGVFSDDLPEFDLAGNNRIQGGTVDIGAYESPFTVTTMEAHVGKIGLSPNPATDFLNLQLLQNLGTPIEVSLFDTQGRLLDMQLVQNEQSLKVAHLPSGAYTLKVIDQGRVYIGKFVKQ